MSDNHSFNTAFAKKYGIEESIIFNNFYYFCKTNKRNNVNCKISEKEPEETRKERFWTFCTHKSLTEQYNYISPSKIHRVIKHLESEGLILIDTFNKVSFDRTCWYTITEKGEQELITSISDNTDCLYESIFQNEKSIFQNEQMWNSKMKNVKFQNGTTIHNITNNITDDITSIITDSLKDESTKNEETKDNKESKKSSKTKKKIEEDNLMSQEYYKEIYDRYKHNFYLKFKGVPNYRNYKNITDSVITRCKEFDISPETCKELILKALDKALNNHNILDKNYSFAYIMSEGVFSSLVNSTNSCSTPSQTPIDYNSQDYGEEM